MSTTTLESQTMGRVTTSATIENLKDVWDAQRGLRPADQVRRAEVADALVDTGTVALSLPSRLIQQLGLAPVGPKETTTTAGVREAMMYEAVRLTIQGRSCTVDVLEVPENVPVLIGQVPLELLDFVVDPQGGRLIGNPAHGGQHMFEMF
jgi:predicted aspartyl protease